MNDSRVIICAFYILINITNSVDCSKILCIFAAPVHTHHIVFRRLSDELLRKGHELVVITPFPEEKSVANLTEINVAGAINNLWKQTTDKWSTDTHDLNQQKKTLLDFVTALCVAQLQHRDVQNFIKYRKDYFDLILIETGGRMHLVFSHIFKAPTILIGSMGAALDNFEVIGAPEHPLLYPPSMSRRFVNVTFWEKVNELYDFYLYKHNYGSQERVENEWLKKIFGEDTPPIRDLYNNVDMFFLNVHKIWDGNRPVPPNVVYLGGLHQTPEKKLPEELKHYLDSSKHGVIYMSFGTNVSPSLFPTEKINMFIKVLSKLPYDVIWKWGDNDLPELPDNIRTYKWLPQADLLRHPNIKLFVTQGGLQSSDEAITAGVPLIGIPMIGDQWYNTEKYVDLKIGKKLQFNSLTEEALQGAIEDVIKDESYRRNIVNLRSIVYDQPQTSLERAVWWIEHVLRHRGGRHLRAAGANTPWAEYLELKIIFTALLALLIAMILFIFLVYHIYKITSVYLKYVEKKNI